MKGLKYIWFFPLTLLLGCGNDIEKIENSTNGSLSKEIRFSVGLISESRATIMNNSNFVVDGRTIGISATKHYGNLSKDSFVPNVMKNQELVYSNGIWSYSPVQYWSESSGLFYSFIAYYPYSPLVIHTSKGIEYNYKNPINADEQVDLLYATTKNINNPGAPVALDFKHALSKVSFNVSGAMVDNVERVEITELNLLNVYNMATFYVDCYTGMSTWRDFSEMAKVNVFKGNYIVTNEKASLGESLLLIPQQLDRTTSSSLNDVQVEVLCRIYGTGSDLYESKRFVFTLHVNKDKEWLSNNSYVYNIKLSIDGFEISGATDVEKPSEDEVHEDSINGLQIN